MAGIYRPSGGYRRLHSFNFTVIVHLGTSKFCRRYIPWKEDPLGKVIGQMTGASRSGKQNIIEGSERAKTSAETEIKLLDVARSSLSELQGDFEDYLIIMKNSIPWSIHCADYKAVNSIMLAEFRYTDDLLHDYWTYLLKEKAKFDPWIEQRDDITAANALLILIQRATGLLGLQLQKLEDKFLAEGGIREKMHQARTAVLANAEGAPECPECNAPMRRRRSVRGPFWGCSRYPECQGLRKLEEKEA